MNSVNRLKLRLTRNKTDHHPETLRHLRGGAKDAPTSQCKVRPAEVNIHDHTCQRRPLRNKQCFESLLSSPSRWLPSSAIQPLPSLTLAMSNIKVSKIQPSESITFGGYTSLNRPPEICVGARQSQSTKTIITTARHYQPHNTDQLVIRVCPLGRRVLQTSLLLTENLKIVYF